VRLGVDLDGVLYNFEKTARFLLGWHFGYDLPTSNKWDFIKANVKKAHWEWLWTHGVAEYGLFRHGHCHKGALEGLRHLRGMGHALIIITSRPKSAQGDTISWLAYHNIAPSEVHILGPDISKSSVSQCAVYIDDHPEHIKDLEVIYPDSLCLLMSRAWNTGYTFGVRVKDWRAVLVHVKTFKWRGEK